MISDSKNLSSILSSHGISQMKIADFDRYGLMTHQMNSGIQYPYPQEYWEYIKYPVGGDQVELHDLHLLDYEKKIEEALFQNQGSVIFANYSIPWSNPNNVEIISKIDSSVSKIIEKSLSKGFRVLCLSDGDIQNSYLNNTVNKKELVFPSILIHPSLDGMTFEKDVDYTHGNFEAQHTFSQIPATILKLMEVFIPSELEQQSLFDSVISHTL